MGFSADNVRGLILALSSSVFIGTSFIIKKKGLMRAGASGVGAGFKSVSTVWGIAMFRGAGGYSYLKEPMWWAGMITMIAGEIANFVAYAYAPAVLVTPLGALSIIVSKILAHFILKERLHMFGVVGIVLYVMGSVGVVVHASQERTINSVKQLWHLALQSAHAPNWLVGRTGMTRKMKKVLAKNESKASAELTKIREELSAEMEKKMNEINSGKTS